MRPLKGMRDLDEAEMLRLRRAGEAVERCLCSYGYRMVEPPILEPVELFLRKSGGELAARMYTFRDPGGNRVSLRPELTAPVIRMFIDKRGAEALPLRWQYRGPVFRYEADEPDNLRQFTQVGAELIGVEGPRADAEVLAVAALSAKALGVAPVTLVVGHVGVLRGFLEQFGLSERAKLFLLSSIGELKRGQGGVEQVRARGRELALLGPRSEEPYGEYGRGGLLGGGANHFGGLLSSQGQPLGSRTWEEIEARLRRKLEGRDEPGSVEKALAFMSEVAKIEGAPQDAVGRARKLAGEQGLDHAPLRALEEVLDTFALHEVGGARVVVDLGLARGLAYYTGMVFEVKHQALKGGASLGGGGRYDGLVKALGYGEDVPALGFALGLERAIQFGGPPKGKEVREIRHLLVVPRTSKAYGAALKTARALRLAGEGAQVVPEPLEGDRGMSYAQRSGCDAIVIVDERGDSERVPVLRK
ncbi:MAG: histidine--tRNA ligase family protein [Chloroflexi bacterium]|nr:histidine--tRNA ligase family protein [Chloroflexota bacterium]